MTDAPTWNAEPAPRARPRIPELGLADDPGPTPTYPKDDEEFVDGGFADEFDDEFDDRPASPVAAIEAPRKPDTPSKPSEAAPADARPKAKPPKDADDDDFDDDDDDFDDDDFDDDDDDDDDHGSMSEVMSTASVVPQRKLPWIPISLAASVLVLLSAYLFRDKLFGTEEAAADEGDELAQTQPEATPEPEPAPEPEVEPKPEPPPPAIPAEELEAMLTEATNLVNRQKHADATKIIDEILTKIPKQADALALRALTQLEGRKHQEALATASDCVESDASQADCWITIAVVEQQNKNLPRALEGYRKYLELAPDGRFAKEAKSQVTRLSAKVEG